MPEIVFVGHVSIDRIRNLHGERVQLGGAAIYAAMGARTICENVGILTAVGNDFSFWDQLAGFQPNLIKKVNCKSTRFYISYDKNWIAHYKSVDIETGSRITTGDVVKSAQGGTKIIHLAPMNPPKVAKMVKAMRTLGNDVKISVNSCINYMDEKANRDAIMAAAALADIFILNERELHALTGKEVVSDAVKSIKANTLVLTLGEIGTIIRSGGNTEFLPAMAAITKNAVDVTGAGDTWSGSFLASLLKSSNWMKAVSYASFISAIKCTGWNFEKIQNLKFRDMEDVCDLAVAFKEKGRQLTLFDALRAREI